MYRAPDSKIGRNVAIKVLPEAVLSEPDRIARFERAPGLPIDDALSIARQIADVLEAAHEKGIVHRDLKPAIVKVTADGKVKVLDSGLARAMHSASAARRTSRSRPRSRDQGAARIR